MSGPRKSFKTKAGTELPLLNLKGKEYLQVMHRIQWFREENPKGILKTQMIEKNGEGKDAFAVFKAEIYVDSERGPMMIATGHKQESAGGFPDYIEKAESGAIGRALALCGYGTQFAADDLDEGDRLADSPAPVVVTGTGDTSGSVTITTTLADNAATPAPKRASFRKNVTLAATGTGDDI